MKISLGAAVTIACLAFALRDVQLEQVAASFRRANYLTLPALLCLLYLFFHVKAVRWRMLLEPVRRFRTRDVVGPMMIGFMGNNILPAHLGELMRVYVMGRRHALSKATVFSTVFLERVFDVVAILAFFGVGVALVEGLTPGYRTLSLITAGVCAAGLLVLSVYMIWTAWFVRVTDAVLGWVPFLPERVREGVCSLLETGAEGLHALRSPRLAAGIVFTSLLQWFLNGVSIYIAVWSFGVTVSPLAALVVQGVIAFGVTIPSTPGFFGVIQACFTESLAPFGVSQADAFAASIYYHIVQYIPVTIVGLVFLHLAGLRLGEVEEAVDGG